MTLFKNVLPSTKMVELYNEDIKRLASLYGMGSDIIRLLAKQCTHRYFYEISNNADEGTDEFLYFQNFAKSVGGNIAHALPLLSVAKLMRAIRKIRKESRGDIYNPVKGKDYLEATFSNSLQKRILENQVSFSNSLAMNFPKAHGTIHIKIREPKGYKGDVFERSGHVISAPYNWKWTVENEGIAVVQSGKRLMFTLKAEYIPKEKLLKDGIKSYKVTLLDPVWSKDRRKSYYDFEPKINQDWWILKKETMDEDLIGVGEDVHSARSLIERRYTSRATKTLLGV
jgi:hypothetical protein|tara:strand:- start:1255 stop:2106 length:852 start_codon:yes stop_codon:yes gene_type:complete